MKKRLIKDIIIHHTATDFGDVKRIRKWHLSRGFSDIGYHFLILNGFRNSYGDLNVYDLGKLEIGRPLYKIGAHARGKNSKSIGIALVGNFMNCHPNECQLRSLVELTVRLIKCSSEFNSVIIIDQDLKNYSMDHIWTHGEIFKTIGRITKCAGTNFPIKQIRDRIQCLIS